MHSVLKWMTAAGALAVMGCSHGKREQAQVTPTVESQGGAANVNLNEVFPAGRGRELVLNNCTTCHTFVPIVVLRMSKESWERNSRDHRERVKALSDADFKMLYEYLVTNFNPERPVPKLPQELLDTWTAY